MNKLNTIKKVLLIGSGPIEIGQGAEFDYSGSQACKAFKEENIEVVLINSNPATIMTDPNMANSVYIEPITLKKIESIIQIEKPDSIITNMGGQTSLNIAIDLKKSGILDKYNIQVIGTSIQTINNTEDRNLFKKLMNDIGEKTPNSMSISSIDEIDKVLDKLKFPLVIRSSYTLGGKGSGIAYNKEDLISIVKSSLSISKINKVLIEENLLGWTEIEYELIRDSDDTCIIVCGMENIDPIGVHTGDSMVITPIQTIHKDIQKILEKSAIKIIKSLNIEGGCNIQFAYKDGIHYVIEVNPRVSRSSALASKATGFPIARYTAKIAIGKKICDIVGNVINKSENYELEVNHMTFKIPKWCFDKFRNVDNTLTTYMKSIGEVMGIGNTIEEVIMKSIDSLDINLYDIYLKVKSYSNDNIKKYLIKPTDERLFIIFESLRRNFNINFISKLSNINCYFIKKLKNIIDLETKLKKFVNTLNYDLISEAKKFGFSDNYIGLLLNFKPEIVFQYRKKYSILPFYQILTYSFLNISLKTVIFSKCISYYYSTYHACKCLNILSLNKKILILGSGPIKIGQGIEFDYSTVHAIDTLKKEGIETLVINNNPDTVSTDFDVSNKLFFDPITLENIIHIIEIEKPYGVIVQFGGQTAINLCSKLDIIIKKLNIKTRILGTKTKYLDIAENRNKFRRALEKIKIKQTKGEFAKSINEAKLIAKNICNYPIIIRKSYIIGGREISILSNEEELVKYMEKDLSNEPILIESFLVNAKEIEIDAVYDGETLFIGGIIEHIEEAGIHSGDSSFIFPPVTISQDILDKVEEYTRKIVSLLHVIGLINIQMAIIKEEIFVLEVNLRASRTIPFISKSIGISLAKLASKVMIGYKLKKLNIQRKYIESKKRPYYIKEVIFPFDKLKNSITKLGPEMKSTGEVMGIDYDLGISYYKAKLASGTNLFSINSIGVFISINSISESIFKMFEILNRELNVSVYLCCFDDYRDYISKYKNMNIFNLIQNIKNRKIDFVLCEIIPTEIDNSRGEEIRKICIESNISYSNTINSLIFIITSLISQKENKKETIKSIEKYN